MSDTLTFVVPGRPVPKGRPRKGKNGFYTPKKTRNYERQVGFCARSEGCGEPLEGDVEVTIQLTFPDRRMGDLDNYCKAICDGMNGIVYEDDKQVARLVVEREFADEGSAKVRVREM